MQAAALLSRQTSEGDVCLNLSEWAGRAIFRDRDGTTFAVTPELDAWSEALRRSPAVGRAGEWTPMILEQGRLYLARLWFHEKRLADALVERAEGWVGGIDEERLRAGLQRLYPPVDEATNWQKIAACLAVLKKLVVISGGPGTGKTRTITSILALILEQTPDARIALVAPTGKAAARLRESVLRARYELPLEPGCAERLPTETSTIHRLLGSRPGRASFRHHAGNSLPVDVLVVDEASMVDLPLMTKLVDALPVDARLLLLGDKDQLASVEAGSVMGDLCLASGDGLGREACAVLGVVVGEILAPVRRRCALSDNVVLLRHSYRFRADSGIGALAEAVNAGDADRTIEILRDRDQNGIHWHRSQSGTLDRALSDRVLPFVRGYAECGSPQQAMEMFQELRVLCVLRDGPRGVAGVNRAIERLLARVGLFPTHRPLYAGKPIMMTRNDPALGVYNGDVALLWPDAKSSGTLRAYFPDADGGVIAVHPGRLPAYATAYAMTVHKSQGSECDRVLIVLPEGDFRLLSRELLYTAITRAKESVEILGEEALIRSAVRRRVARGSGLAQRLCGRSEVPP